MNKVKNLDKKLKNKFGNIITFVNEEGKKTKFSRKGLIDGFGEWFRIGRLTNKLIKK